MRDISNCPKCNADKTHIMIKPITENGITTKFEMYCDKCGFKVDAINTMETLAKWEYLHNTWLPKCPKCGSQVKLHSHMKGKYTSVDCPLCGEICTDSGKQVKQHKQRRECMYIYRRMVDDLENA